MQAEEIIRIDPVLQFIESWSGPLSRWRALGIMLEIVGKRLHWFLSSSPECRPHLACCAPRPDPEHLVLSVAVDGTFTIFTSPKQSLSPATFHATDGVLAWADRFILSLTQLDIQNSQCSLSKQKKGTPSLLAAFREAIKRQAPPPIKQALRASWRRPPVRPSLNRLGALHQRHDQGQPVAAIYAAMESTQFVNWRYRLSVRPRFQNRIGCEVSVGRVLGDREAQAPTTWGIFSDWLQQGLGQTRAGEPVFQVENTGIQRSRRLYELLGFGASPPN